MSSFTKTKIVDGNGGGESLVLDFNNTNWASDGSPSNWTLYNEPVRRTV